MYFNEDISDFRNSFSVRIPFYSTSKDTPSIEISVEGQVKSVQPRTLNVTKDKPTNIFITQIQDTKSKSVKTVVLKADSILEKPIVGTYMEVTGLKEVSFEGQPMLLTTPSTVNLK